MRLDHLLSKEHSPRTVCVVRVMGSCRDECSRADPLNWVEHYRAGSRLDLHLLGSGPAGGGSGVRTEHTVGCLKQHRCFWLALIPEMPGLLSGCGWGWCVLFENCTVDASIFNCFVFVSV